MQFQVLSHAGLLLESDPSAGTQACERLLFDPWLIGSCYWRSWWNLPEPSASLLATIKPTAIYLTHLHWDHFHGPSLRLFDRNTPIYVPKINHRRMVEDLNWLGFHNVIEIAHGTTVAIGSKLKLHSFQFGPSNDSAAIVTDGKQVLFNLNDCKLFGLALKELTHRFGAPDFMLRSHSSATSIPYCIEDYQRLPSPRPASEYAEEFFTVAKTLRAKHAIPFASNHCFVHSETMRFNHTAATPQLLLDKAKEMTALGSPSQAAAQSQSPLDCLKIMPPGSRFDNTNGFQIQEFDYSDIPGYVDYIRRTHADKFEATQKLEDESHFDRAAFDSYFSQYQKSAGIYQRNDHIGFAVKNGDGSIERVKFSSRGIENYRALEEVDFEIECHARIINDCTNIRMFSTWGASKRLKIRLREDAALSKVGKLLTLLDAHEHHLIPLYSNLSLRSLGVRARRWREAAEAGRMVWYKFTRGSIPSPIELYSE